MKALDRVFGWLLALGGIGHGLGSYKAYGNQPMALIWALSASFAVFLLAAINLLRTERAGDRTLAWISFAGCAVWIGFVLWFGALIGNIFDFRPLINLILTLVLTFFSLRSALRPAPG
ncbi:MAG: hypothetical protein JOY62_19160 [Acidobacteriaceae bacterium]|nr:hypothetical protein [Acidobacteriaceae bacterium]MBV9782085.1 hypothetical protein [Acidobacteriaceae bacterium]